MIEQLQQQLCHDDGVDSNTLTTVRQSDLLKKIYRINNCHHRNKIRRCFPNRTITESLSSVMIVFVMTMIIVCCQFGYESSRTRSSSSMMVYGYPTGAGGCIGGQAAVVNSSHVNPLLHATIRGGSLSSGGVIVTIQPLKKDDSSTNNAVITLPTNQTLLTNMEYKISVIGTQYVYKGCLIRLQGLSEQSDNTIATSLEPLLNTHSAEDVCSKYTNVVGITHNNSEFKQEHTGIVRLDEPGDILFDITIVGLNNQSASLYAYNNFTVSFGDDGTLPITTSAPAQPSAPTPIAPVAPVPTSNGEQPTTSNSTIDTKYTELVEATVDTIQVTYENVALLSLPDLRNLEAVTKEWFEQFYNNRTSQEQQSSTNTASSNKTETTAVSVTAPGSRRQLKNSSSTTSTSPPPPQAFVVKGTMETVITIVGQVPSASSNVVTYNQKLTYRLHTKDSPLLPSSMTGDNYKPLSPSQYTLVPYRSTSGNTDLASLLKEQLPTPFENIVAPIAVPIVADPNDSGAASSSRSGGLGIGIIAGIVAGSIAGIAILFYGYRYICSNSSSGSKKRDSEDDDSEDDDDDDDNADNNRKNNSRLIQPNHSDDPSSFDVDSQFTTPVTPRRQEQSVNVFAKRNHNNQTDAPVSGGGRSALDGGSSVATPSVVSVATPSTYMPTPSDEYVVYAPSGKLGIVVDNPEDDSGPIIYAIKETSPLLDSKLNVGDRLVMVDEVDVTKMPPALISKLISRRSQNPMRKLTLHRAKDPQDERMAV